MTHCAFRSLYSRLIPSGLPCQPREWSLEASALSSRLPPSHQLFHMGGCWSFHMGGLYLFSFHLINPGLLFTTLHIRNCNSGPPPSHQLFHIHGGLLRPVPPSTLSHGGADISSLSPDQSNYYSLNMQNSFQGGEIRSRMQKALQKWWKLVLIYMRNL